MYAHDLKSTATGTLISSAATAAAFSPPTLRAALVTTQCCVSVADIAPSPEATNSTGAASSGGATDNPYAAQGP